MRDLLIMTFYSCFDGKGKVIARCQTHEEIEVISRLARIGYENVVGYISNLTEWKKNKQIDYIKSIESTQIEHYKNNVAILDVRREDELKLGFVKNSIHIPLSQLSDNLDKIPISDNLIVYCAGGYRSMIASSILQSKGFQGIKNIYGGFNVIARNSPNLI